MLLLKWLSGNFGAEPQGRHGTTSDLYVAIETRVDGDRSSLSWCVFDFVDDECFSFRPWQLTTGLVNGQTVVCLVIWTVRSSWCEWQFFVEITMTMASTKPPTQAWKKNSCSSSLITGYKRVTRWTPQTNFLKTLRRKRRQLAKVREEGTKNLREGEMSLVEWRHCHGMC